MKVKVGVSNRHIHLCNEDAKILFGEDYKFTKRNDLSQKGEYACNETVILSTDKYEFPHVRVMGPNRDYTQVEISADDALLLGIDPPFRDSGDLDNSESILITGPVGKLFKENCCIKSVRHIHCNKTELPTHNNGDIVTVKTLDGKIIDNVHIKMKDTYNLEMHIDRTDAEKYNLNNGDYIEFE